MRLCVRRTWVAMHFCAGVLKPGARCKKWKVRVRRQPEKYGWVSLLPDVRSSPPPAHLPLLSHPCRLHVVSDAAKQQSQKKTCEDKKCVPPAKTFLESSSSASQVSIPVPSSSVCSRRPHEHTSPTPLKRIPATSSNPDLIAYHSSLSPRPKTIRQLTQPFKRRQSSALHAFPS